MSTMLSRTQPLVRQVIDAPVVQHASDVRCRAGRERRRLLLGLAALALSSRAWPAHAAFERGNNGAAPALVLNDLDGRRRSLADYRNRVVVVNFWATWCAPCVQEMPDLAQLRERLTAAGVEVLGVNHRENAARIRPFVERLDIGFPVLRDHDGSVAAAWSVRVFPTTFVLDTGHRVAYVAIGELDWSSADVESRIRALVATAPASARAAASRPHPFG
jgi:peroxiredoxin